MKTTKNKIYTITLIKDGLLFKNHCFLDQALAFSCGENLANEIEDTTDYIVLEAHEPNSERSGKRLKQWDIDDLK
jgi:hypothetical protein